MDAFAMPIQLSLTDAHIDYGAERLRGTFPNAEPSWQELSEAGKQKWRDKVKEVCRAFSDITPEEGAGPDPMP